MSENASDPFEKLRKASIENALPISLKFRELALQHGAPKSGVWDEAFAWAIMELEQRIAKLEVES